MPPSHRPTPPEKPDMHPRNLHQGRYDLALLTSRHPALAPFVRTNEHGMVTIDFSDPAAVKQLNTALLKTYYGVKFWDIPEGYLCPPVPGRADYLHHMADLLARCNDGVIPQGKTVRCLDVGVGANAVYPIIGRHVYGWSFVGSDTDPVAVKAATAIVQFNPELKGAVEIRHQTKAQELFFGVIGKQEMFDLTVCNPPFHSSAEEAQAETERKWHNLNPEKAGTLNFGGQSGELWYPGGEEKFVTAMVRQSRQFSGSVFWFSSLVSKKDNLRTVYDALRKVEAAEVVTLPMAQGNKVSRAVAWTFLTKAEQARWKEDRWGR